MKLITTRERLRTEEPAQRMLCTTPALPDHGPRRACLGLDFPRRSSGPGQMSVENSTEFITSHVRKHSPGGASMPGPAALSSTVLAGSDWRLKCASSLAVTIGVIRSLMHGKPGDQGFGADRLVGLAGAQLGVTDN